jgi:hypothetical protein
LKIGAEATSLLGLRYCYELEAQVTMALRSFSLGRFAPALAGLYFVALCAVLLYPFDVSNSFATIENTAAGQSDGVYFGTSGMLRSPAPPVALYDRLTAGTGLSLEMWVNSASADQDGPARIISYSLDPWHRNFTLAQEGDGLIVRLRTTRTDHNGIHPELRIPDVFRAGVTQHIVMTYDFSQQRIYVDGEQKAAGAVPGGDFRNWDPTCFLVFGNEATGARAWHGTISYAAVYDKALSAESVAIHYQSDRVFQVRLDKDRPVVTFDFTRGLNELKGISASISTIVPVPLLNEPERIYTRSPQIFSFFQDADGRIRLVGDAPVWDLIRNVVLFVPLGFFLYLSFARCLRPATLVVLATVLVGAFVSATLEGLQIFLPDRTSSIFDVIMNIAGMLCGSVVPSLGHMPRLAK